MIPVNLDQSKPKQIWFSHTACLLTLTLKHCIITFRWTPLFIYCNYNKWRFSLSNNSCMAFLVYSICYIANGSCLFLWIEQSLLPNPTVFRISSTYKIECPHKFSTQFNTIARSIQLLSWVLNQLFWHCETQHSMCCY